MKKEEIKKEGAVKSPVGIVVTSKDNSQDAAFRILDKGKELFYASTRIGGLNRVNGGYAVLIPSDDFEKFVGKQYTLVTLGAKRILLEGEVESLSKDKTNGSK